MRSLLLVCVCSLAVLVAGHARLSDPPAWNTGYSKTAACGGVGALSTTPNLWAPGSTKTLTWQIIAGDGVGPVTVKLDRTGGTTFTETITTSTDFTTVGTYQISVTLPSNLNCSTSSTTGMCSLQLASSSNWYSCTSFRTSAAAAAPATTNPTCVLAQNLTTCTMVNGLRVGVPVGETVQSMDAVVGRNLAETGVNPNVLATYTKPGCQESFKAYLCGTTFSICAPNSNTPPTIVNSCRLVCEQMTCFCGVTETHKYLYDCADSTNAGRDASGPCTKGWGPGNSTCTPSSTGGSGGPGDGGSASTASFSVTVFMLLAVALLALIL